MFTSRWPFSDARGCPAESYEDSYPQVQEHLVFAKPANADDLFPEDVEYQQRCGSICRTSSSAQQVQLYDNILQAASSYASRVGVGRKVSSEDLVIALGIYTTAAPAVVPAAVRCSDLREAHGSVGVLAPGLQ